jgi:hypothetical protein
MLVCSKIQDSYPGRFLKFDQRSACQKAVDLFVGSAHECIRHFEILSRGHDASMTEKGLESSQIETKFEKVRRKTMPQRVNTLASLNASTSLCRLPYSRHRYSADSLRFCFAWKKPIRGLVLPIIVSKYFPQ